MVSAYSPDLGTQQDHPAVVVEGRPGGIPTCVKCVPNLEKVCYFWSRKLSTMINIHVTWCTNYKCSLRSLMDIVHIHTKVNI